MMRLSGHCAITAVLTCVVGIQGTVVSGGRIYNGITAVEKEFPYVVSVGEAHLCGGFIYSSNFVVTAASCVYGARPSQLKVRAGKLSLSVQDPNEQVLNVFDIHVFSGFNPTSRLHDIALLETAQQFVFNDYVQPVLFKVLDNSPSKAIVAGWGATSDGGTSSTKLRKTSVTLPADCTADYGSLFFPDYMICAGDFAQDNSSPCRFDEGSPLVQDGAVVGIVSQNKGCNPVDNHLPPTIYTYVFPYTPWLDKIAGPQQTL